MGCFSQSQQYFSPNLPRSTGRHDISEAMWKNPRCLKKDEKEKINENESLKDS